MEKSYQSTCWTLASDIDPSCGVFTVTPPLPELSETLDTVPARYVGAAVATPLTSAIACTV
jgi:hypothetical protein